ncbi:uncharacterized protein LOC144714749 isoform X3 [Wolffia australiana]
MELSFCERAMAVFLGCLVCSPEVFLPLSRQNEERAVMINSNADEDRISNVKAALTFIAKATLKDITGKRAEEAQAFKEKSLSFLQFLKSQILGQQCDTKEDIERSC